MIYDVNGRPIDDDVPSSIVGDGVADDTVALQELVSTRAGVVLPSNLKIRITSPITIDTKTITFFDGGNSTFVIDGDFVGFNIIGSTTATTTGNPSSLTSGMIDKEAGFTICNCKITSTNHSGVAIKLDGTYKARIDKCYIYDVKTGIQFSNVLRDSIVSNCIIYEYLNYGVHLDSTSNHHQLNIIGNHIAQGTYGIFVDNPEQLANFQVTGNDIEFGYYPTNNYLEQRGLYIYTDNTKAGQMSEIEICGNTIQGHGRSQKIIEIVGGTRRLIKHTSIVGNHISNTQGGDIIILTKVKGFSCSGNTFKDGGYVYNITDCQNLVITAEAATNVTGLYTESGTNVGLVIDNNTTTTSQ